MWKEKRIGKIAMVKAQPRSHANSPVLFYCLLTGLVGMAASIPSSAAILSVTIKDERGKPVAARAYLTDSNNNSFFPKGTVVYDKVSADGTSERNFVPPGGSFSIELPVGKYRLVVERGKEYTPIDISIEISEPAPIDRAIVLKRWVDMPARGWYSGDMHVHRQLDDLPALMEAEDLSVAVPFTRWRTVKKDQVYEAPDLQRYLSGADAEGVFHLKDGRFFPVVNEELEPRASALLASFLGNHKVDLSYPLASFGKSVQAMGGVSDSEKATSLEFPALAAVGACQLVGLANNHLWRSGGHTLPWGAWPDRMLGKYPQTCSGFVQSGFDMYAALLNMGFLLKVSAGSASGVHPVPPGWSRVYVHTQGPLTSQSWYKGLKEGRSFVTTGPMLFLHVNDKEPGEEFHAEDFPMKLHASIEMLSLVPLSEAEIVLNGVPHKVALKPDGGEPNSYRGSLDLTVVSSTWITARWSSALPNGCGAAHTSPIYFWQGTRPIPIPHAEAEMLLDRVKKLIRQVEMGDPGGAFVLDSAVSRQGTLDYLNHAREVYERKLQESFTPEAER